MGGRWAFILLLISSFCNNLCQSSSISSTTSRTYNKGQWKLLKKSIGISAMHIALLPNDRFVAFDRTDAGSSNISLPGGGDHDLECTINGDCFAHSVEFNPSTRTVRALTLKTDTFCSSGAISPDGVLVQSGGFNNGDHAVRYFKPCNNCDWEEHVSALSARRWYASNHILPNGKIIVVGGRREFSYEFIPKTSDSDTSLYHLPFLSETRDSLQLENNLYPFLHLSPDGNLFIFANNRSILLDYEKNRVVRSYPVMPGRASRNYPSSGSSVLLPLKLISTHGSSSTTNTTTTPEAEVLICGGTPSDSNSKANNGIFVLASNTCGRLVINAENPTWEMEEMPFNRTMGDLILLPTGDVLIINGASRGTAGWNVARDPVLNPVLYQPNKPKNGTRFDVLNPTTIPRLYHSVAYLLSDARVLVGGSNPYIHYSFNGLYPTELSLEAFSPPYLNKRRRRPKISWIKPGNRLSYKQHFIIGFQLRVKLESVSLTMVAPPFTTHSVSMSQRLLVLDVGEPYQLVSSSDYAVDAYAPATAFLAPQGYYRLFVVNAGVPSRAVWVHIS